METVMKLGKVILPLMLLVLFGAGACYAAECPIEVKVIRRGEITATAIVDTVTIQDIKANRGNADSYYKKDLLPITLKFGETRYLPIEPLITIKEIEVQTNLGSWKFTFK